MAEGQGAERQGAGRQGAGRLSKLLILTTILVRLGIGILVFILLARALGPSEFGLVSTIFGYASLASLLSDFGLYPKTLREIAAHPSEGGRILADALDVKLFLVTAAMLLGLVAILLLPLGTDARLASLMLAAGTLIASYGDLAMVAFRSLGRYATETKTVVLSSLVYGLLVLLGYLLDAGLVLLAGAFLLSRLLYVAAVRFQLARLFLRQPTRTDRGGRLLRSLRSAGVWALTNNMGYLGMQVDGLLIPPLLGLHASGIYNAGSRFASAAVTFVGVVESTEVPRVAAARAAGRSTRSVELRAWLEMSGLGLLGGLTLYLLGPSIRRHLIGPGFEAVDELWLGLGCLTFLRFCCSSVGVSLIALNRPRARLIAEMTTAVANTSLLLLLLPRLGLQAAPWLLCAGSMMTLAAMLGGRFLWGRREGARGQGLACVAEDNARQAV